MGQNQNRPPRDTPAQQMGRTPFESRDPQGQDKALRAMEMIAHTLINPNDDEGPDPGSDVYFEMLKRAGIPMEVLDVARSTGDPASLPPFNDMLRMYDGGEQDDEFYGQDVTPDTIRTMDKLEPWVIPNINKIADADAEAGLPHRGYDIQETQPLPPGVHGTSWERKPRYLSVESQDTDPTYRSILMQLLGPANAPNR